MLKMLAASTLFIFTVTGYLAQLRKLFIRRQKAISGEILREDVCYGLS